MRVGKYWFKVASKVICVENDFKMKTVLNFDVLNKSENLKETYERSCVCSTELVKFHIWFLCSKKTRRPYWILCFGLSSQNVQANWTKIKLCSVFYELLNEIAKCGESWDEKFQQQRHFVNQQCSRVLSIFEWEQRLSLLFNALTGLLCWQRRRSPRRTVFCGCSWTDESSFRVKGLLACIFFLFAAVCGWSYKSSFCFWVGNKGERFFKGKTISLKKIYIKKTRKSSKQVFITFKNSRKSLSSNKVSIFPLARCTFLVALQKKGWPKGVRRKRVEKLHRQDSRTLLRLDVVRRHKEMFARAVHTQHPSGPPTWEQKGWTTTFLCA